VWENSEDLIMSNSFGATSTTDEVLRGINLSGKRVLVTGVSAGLGVETARALAAHGAQVTGAARDLPKAQAATEQVRAQATSGGSLHLVQLDLASLDSVRRCADGLLAANKPFDMIIANAGVMACPKGATVDGFETQFGTNHLGHFVLVNRIASLLKTGSRLVNLSSAGHPGGIQTELGRYMTPEVRERLIARINASQPKGAAPFSYKSIPQGAATSVWAACAAEAGAIGGRYCEDCHVAEVVSIPGLFGGVRPYALDPQHAQALWQKSEELVGERFN
jgi:NAD(P)-dependent dehydrogenase (short-subunit alcohol dehydrogenase family)